MDPFETLIITNLLVDIGFNDALVYGGGFDHEMQILAIKSFYMDIVSGPNEVDPCSWTFI